MTKNEFRAVRTQESCEWVGYTNAPLSVNISIQPTRRPLSTYRVCVFNHDLYPIAEAYCISKNTASVRKKDYLGNPIFTLRFELKSDVCWFPGEYVAVLYQGREPVSHCRFNLYETNYEEARADMDDYERGSDDYLAARDLYTNVFHYLPHDCSKSQFKQQLTTFYGREKAMKVLEEAGLGEKEAECDFVHLLCLDTDEEKGKQHSRNMVVHVMNANPLGPAYAIIRAIPALDHPATAGALREVWNIRKMVEEHTTSLPKVMDDVSLVIYNLSGLYKGGEAGKKLATELISTLSNGQYMHNRIVLCDQQYVIDTLFDHYPELIAFFPVQNHLTIDSAPSLHFFAKEFLDNLRRQNFEISDEVEGRISGLLYVMWCEKPCCQTSIIDELVADIMKRHSQRLLEKMSANALPGDEGRLLHYEDVESALYESFKHWDRIDRDARITDIEALVSLNDCPALKTLNSMTGLQRVKSEVTQALTMARFSALRRHFHLEESVGGRHHMLFMGNPGTGKTTVAKLIGEIYHRMGLLSKGHTVVCDRMSLIGQYIGESENKVRDKLEDAQGGVLFVDEAYSLFAGNNERDYGRHIIECLLTKLSEPNPDMIIIFAGYEERLSALFNVNPGLRDRFPISLHFDDFSADELFSIIRNLAAQRKFTLTPTAEDAIRGLIARKLAARDPQFGNARWATNLFDLGILRAMAERTMNALSAVTDERRRLSMLNRPETLTCITEDDIHKAEAQYIEPMAPRKQAVHRIGFLAQSA